MSLVVPEAQVPLIQSPEVSHKPFHLDYEVVKLKKTMELRAYNRKVFKAMKFAKGFEPIDPKIPFKDCLLTKVIPEPNSPSKCKFLIVVAMYNESSEHFVNTMTGVNDNLKLFCESKMNVEEIVCVVIVDGMRPFLQTYEKEKEFFCQFFDENAIKERFNVSNLMDCKIPNQEEYDEFAHLFMQDYVFGANEVPLQTILCVKQFNKRKLNTHLWFFGGFCEMINPTFVMLLDVGTKPLEGSLFYLYEAMDCYPNIAGCCGEIRPLAPSFWKLVVGAQVVEYKFSHMLDKALESVIGYITVLPGAFSAYRWKALEGAPLWEDYFKSICHPELMNAFNSNIYLAEDRVLCLALVTKKNENYVLRYVKKSLAETDVPESLSELMAQRRRWINGSWFALIDSLIKFKKIYQSNHTLTRKILFTAQMVYYIVSVIYTWFIVGLFCVAYVVAIRRYFNIDTSTSWLSLGEMMILFYIILLGVLFIEALAVKPRRVEGFYKFTSYVLGAYQIFVTVLIFTFVLASTDTEIFIPAYAAGIGSFAFIVLINCQIFTILRGAVHYLFLVPTYVNVFFIYSICNIHDCTWGNRPDSLSAEEKERIEEFEEFRTRWALLWLLSNSSLMYYFLVVSDIGNPNSDSYYALLLVAGFGFVVLVIRLFGGIIYLISESCKKSINEKHEIVINPAIRASTYSVVFK